MMSQERTGATGIPGDNSLILFFEDNRDNKNNECKVQNVVTVVSVVV